MVELQVYTCTFIEDVDELPNGYIHTKENVKGDQMFELLVYTCTIIEEVDELPNGFILTKERLREIKCLNYRSTHAQQKKR